MELRGKVALITGAAQGIGEGIARRFVREGAEVAALDLQEEKLAGFQKELGDALLPLRADMGEPREVERAFDATVSRFGGVDILVNCAVVRANVPLDQLDEATVDQALAVGVKGLIFCTRRAAMEMRAREGGAIVNMSSFYVRTPVKERVMYVAVKGAVEGLTRAFAVELAQHGIRVNAVAPGPILTERRRALGHGDPRNLAERYRNAPMGRFGNVEEVVDTVLYLATDRSSYMTGQTLVLDGGLTIT